MRQRHTRSAPNGEWREMMLPFNPESSDTNRLQVEHSWIRAENAMRQMLRKTRKGLDAYDLVTPRLLMREVGMSPSTFYSSIVSKSRVAGSIVLRDLSKEVWAIRDTIRTEQGGGMPEYFLGDYLTTLAEYGEANPREAMALVRGYGEGLSYQWANARRMGGAGSRGATWHPAIHIATPIMELIAIVKDDKAAVGEGISVPPCESEYAGFVMGTVLAKGASGKGEVDLSKIPGMESLLAS